MKPSSKLAFAALTLGSVLAWPNPSFAADCVTDMDCPGTTCGGQVCQWVTSTSHVCQDPGSKSRGSDGWCNTSADCKCASVGAKCNAEFSCSFVLASDAPPAGGAGGTSGAGGASSGGAAGTGASGAPSSSGGSSASAGDSSGGALTSGGAAPSSAGADSTTASTAGSNAQSGPVGPITGSPSTSDSSGCQISSKPTRSHALFGLGLLSAGLLFARRRRSA